MTRVLRGVLALLMHATVSVTASGQLKDDTIFAVAGRPAQHAVVTAEWAEPTSWPLSESPMLQEIAGIAAVLNAREIRELNRAVEPQTRIDSVPDSPERGWVVHLAPRAGAGFSETSRVRIRLHPEGWPFAETPTRRVRLRTAAFERVSRGWLQTRPTPGASIAAEEALPDEGADPAEPAPEIHHPGTHDLTPHASTILLDARTLSDRFARGGRVPFQGVLTRSIEDESLSLAFPTDASPRVPIGLLVWVNPTPSGDPPPPVLAAAAELGLAVIVPANAGNDRPIVDRLQVTLDAVATARRVIWLDRDRIYLAGFSGGGRVSSMLWAAAPDVFTGAVCIGGINSQHAVPTGDGRSWPPSHRIPAGDLGRALRDHPIAAISGARDFNFSESRARIDALARDGYNARLFDVAGLGHLVPETSHIADALRWIDNAVTQQRAEDAVAARALLEKIEPERLASPASELTVRERRMLERVTRIAPWTEPAWQAAAALGYAAPLVSSTAFPLDGP